MTASIQPAMPPGRGGEGLNRPVSPRAPGPGADDLGASAQGGQGSCDHGGEARLHAILDAALDCVISIDHRGLVTYFNKAAEQTFGYGAEEVMGRELAGVIVPPSLRDAHRAGLARQLETGEERILGRRIELTGMRRDGTEFPVELTITRTGGPEAPAFTAYIRDITERRQAERQRRRDTKLLRSRAAQQLALTELGLLALGGGPLQGLLEKATVLVAQTLDVDLAQALELDPGADCLRLRAGIGLRAGAVGTATVETGRGPLAGYTVARDQPVVVEDMRAERRFRAPSLLLEHGVVSGLAVVIHGGDRRRGTEPWGVLGADTCSARTFTEEDVNPRHAGASTKARLRRRATLLLHACNGHRPSAAGLRGKKQRRRDPVRAAAPSAAPPL
jgi:PAS domain S-box-containing protein